MHGQALWAKSAYGHQIRLAIGFLRDLGVEVGQAVTFGFSGRKMELSGITLYPSLNDPNGQDVIAHHARDFRADYVLSLGDVFMFRPELWTEFNWLPWVTVDSKPLWPSIAAALGNPAKPVRIFAYSKYGQASLQEAGIDASYLPLCFDPSAFYPMDCADARKALNLPNDRFIVGMVQANRQRDGRKALFDQIIAFREFQKSRPDALLYLHTCMSPLRGGFDLAGLADHLGMELGRDYVHTDEYVETTIGATDDQMRTLYGAFDVLLQATKAEGFGVPALEASACRRPVIYTDYAALPEAVHMGYRVEHDLEWQPCGTFYARPRVPSIVDALRRAYLLQPYDLIRGEPTQYRADRVIDDYWRPLVAWMSARQPEAVPA
jgi:glycosyltransferase involved in cell wall biosynthesis